MNKELKWYRFTAGHTKCKKHKGSWQSRRQICATSLLFWHFNFTLAQNPFWMALGRGGASAELSDTCINLTRNWLTFIARIKTQLNLTYFILNTIFLSPRYLYILKFLRVIHHDHQWIHYSTNYVGIITIFSK